MIGDVNNTITQINPAATVFSGTQVTSGQPVTFDGGAADSVTTLAAHGMPAGTPVMFSVISLTTGISVGVQYFVANPTATTFQVAATLAAALAGTPILPLTTNGTGTIGATVSAN